MDDKHTPHCLSRRTLLLAGARLTLLSAVPGMAAPVWAEQAEHPPLPLARLSTLSTGVPVWFDYPRAGFANVLVKLGEPAAGVLSRSATWSPLARVAAAWGDLRGTLQARHAVLGPCPRHLTTFDLTRHGIVITGHATQSLPQVLLRQDGDDIVAVGMQGLVFGMVPHE
ncbi:MAG: arsenate reductase (azurin) small subunit [Rhodoferax sp.]|nr:arsenate reductase (azurin) small subunit [Rhodoferax sp.]